MLARLENTVHGTDFKELEWVWWSGLGRGHVLEMDNTQSIRSRCASIVLQH